ncbi:MAG TPA: S46 family peptidase [Saprospiraceae bacterium]|nr:S46 family peptidase [Saprospiraceae bacterium]HNT21371.1 S46 family peptidase [Saprospiraceae bacterium]
MRNRTILCFLFIGIFLHTTRADEGMWLPQLLSVLNESRMKSLGMKISAKDIYNTNTGSLKDAVVSFGGFCTGAVISSNGLVLTNHHCGFDAIQNHSTLDKNYIRDGFWAQTRADEIPNPGLFVTFIVRIDDVSREALRGLSPSMTESERQGLIDKNLAELTKNVKKESGQESFTRGFFEGNQYYLFVTETYRDVRLVGAPPSQIGNFGKDTDNWVWPRHTGDFSLFRIYASRDNKPAEYAPDNVPYTPKKSFDISMDGVEPGDFTFVFGFPGRTMQYLHSEAVRQILEVSDPAKIGIRERALKILDGFMREDEQVKIQYAAKYAGIQNSYKKWQGEVLGLNRAGAVGKKQKYEALFQQRVDADAGFRQRYGSLLNELSKGYESYEPYGLASDYYLEIISKIEMFTIASQLNSLVTAFEKGGENGYRQRLPVVKSNLENILGEFSGKVDRRMFEELMDMYVQQPGGYVSPLLKERLKAAGGNYINLSLTLYGQTSLFDMDQLNSLFARSAGETVEAIRRFEAVQLFVDLQKTYQSLVQSPSAEIQNRINRLQRDYMQAQLEVMKEKKFYPDANRTLRVTFGQVQGYSARNAVQYHYYTDLDGVMEKYKPGDYEFDVPEKLRALHAAKDFGPYGSEGVMPVCFIATNHTTGGNSGSPALDARGNLIGLNFDRAWEGTMSDIHYDASICRNIMVDIRYVLFIIDKYAGAGHLIREMKLVHPKKGPKKKKSKAGL